VGGFLENVGNLDEPLFFGLTGKIGVAVAGLGFSGKGGQDIFFGLASFEAHDCSLSAGVAVVRSEKMFNAI